MSEISREEAIKDIKENVLSCVGGKSLVKAISDMEKLEKIEALFQPKAFGEYPSNYEDIVKEVRKILKE